MSDQFNGGDRGRQLQMPTQELPLDQLTVAVVKARADDAAASVAVSQGMTGFGSALHAALAKFAGEHAQKLARTVAEQAKYIPLPKEKDLLVKDGMLVHDALFADHLVGLGEAGQKFAAEIRERSRHQLQQVVGDQERFKVGLWLVPAKLHAPELWYLWDTGRGEETGKKVPGWTCVLGAVLWEGESGEVLRRLRAPAMAFPFAQDTSRLRRAVWSEGQIVDDRGDPSPLVPVGPAQLDALARQGLDALDTPTADRLFGWLLRTGFELHAADPERPAHMYSKEIVGGYRAIAEDLGVRGGKASNEIAALLAALNRCSLSWNVPGVSRGQPLPLVHLMAKDHCRPGVRETFSLGLSPLWTPGLCHLLTGTERLIVPWIDLPMLPIHNHFHRAAVRMWRSIRLCLRVQAAELPQGVRLDWASLAAEAGLPDDRLPALIEAWTAETGPLKASEGRITPRDPTVLALLLEGAGRQQNQRTRGRRGADRRRKDPK